MVCHTPSYEYNELGNRKAGAYIRLSMGQVRNLARHCTNAIPCSRQSTMVHRNKKQNELCIGAK